MHVAARSEHKRLCRMCAEQSSIGTGLSRRTSVPSFQYFISSQLQILSSIICGWYTTGPQTAAVPREYLIPSEPRYVYL